MHWGLTALGAVLALIGVALARQFRNQRTVELEDALRSLLRAIETEDRVDSLPRRLELAVWKAREVLGG
jgi:choline-glycine betaine transporter